MGAGDMRTAVLVRGRPLGKAEGMTASMVPWAVCTRFMTRKEGEAVRVGAVRTEGDMDRSAGVAGPAGEATKLPLGVSPPSGRGAPPVKDADILSAAAGDMTKLPVGRRAVLPAPPAAGAGAAPVAVGEAPVKVAFRVMLAMDPASGFMPCGDIPAMEGVEARRLALEGVRRAPVGETKEREGVRPALPPGVAGLLAGMGMEVEASTRTALMLERDMPRRRRAPGLAAPPTSDWLATRAEEAGSIIPPALTRPEGEAKEPTDRRDGDDAVMGVSPGTRPPIVDPLEGEAKDRADLRAGEMGPGAGEVTALTLAAVIPAEKEGDLGMVE